MGKSRHTRRPEYETTGLRRTAAAAARGRGEDLAGGEATHSRSPWHPLNGNREGNIGVESEEADGDVDWPERERVDGKILKKNRERPRVERRVSPRLETGLFGSGDVRISLTVWWSEKEWAPLSLCL
jgi:hypothetical protein